MPQGFSSFYMASAFMYMFKIHFEILIAVYPKDKCFGSKFPIEASITNLGVDIWFQITGLNFISPFSSWSKLIFVHVIYPDLLKRHTLVSVL